MTYTRKTIGKSLPDGTYIEITAEERDDPGTLCPGFSITIDGWEKHGTWNGRACKRNGRDIDFGGQGHDTILRAAPELAPLVRAHLADQDGTPMHAEANGWYFYSGKARAYDVEKYGQEYADRNGTPHEMAARCLHIDPSELPEGLDKDGFSAFCASLRETWAARAEAARATLAGMVDGEGVES